MITARLSDRGDILLIAPVRGLASEAPAALRLVQGHDPAAVGLGISPEELRGLVEYFVRSAAEPVVPLTTAERSEVRGLVRFGEVSVPNPSFLSVVRWATAGGVPTEGLDPGEDATATLFADNIGYLELVRRTVRERNVSRNPPAPDTPDEFALRWDHHVARGRGSRKFAGARDLYLVRAARRLAATHSRVVVIIDRERFDGVRALFDAPPT
ncbi:MAG: hypothetical protein L3K02_01015 [Thermoplasmata archaeon]|nr:hypothetical protein [Thermoplasmata archaeon]